MKHSLHCSLRPHLLCLVVACSLIPACDSRPPKPPLSPRETVHKLRELRERRAYTEMEPLILRARRRSTIDFLTAVDEFLAANRQLGDYVLNNIGEGQARALDCGGLAADLEIFSRQVEVLDERIEGDRAAVSVTIAGRLPAIQAEFRLEDNVWRYDPGPGGSPSWPEAFRRMAHGMRQVVEELRSGRISIAEARANPNRLGEELVVRMRPGMRLLTPPADAPGGD